MASETPVSTYPDPSFHLLTTPHSLKIHHILPTDGYANFINDLYNNELFTSSCGKSGIDSTDKALGFINNDSYGIVGQFKKNPYGNYAVSLTKGGAETLIGTVSLMRGHYTVPDVGFAFLPEYSGKGYATEAARRIIDYALSPKEEGGLGLEGVFGFTSQRNEKSISVLRRLGFEYRGVYALEAFGGEKSAVYALKNMKEDLSYYGVRGGPIEA